MLVNALFVGIQILTKVSSPISSTGKNAAIIEANNPGNWSSGISLLENMAKGALVYFFKVTEKMGPAIMMAGMAMMMP